MVTMFSLFAEIERDLISERTKEGLARARAEEVTESIFQRGHERVRLGCELEGP
jgi:DNA invertase Pin-like site-specific DNA recombinase